MPLQFLELSDEKYGESYITKILFCSSLWGWRKLWEGKSV